MNHFVYGAEEYPARTVWKWGEVLGQEARKSEASPKGETMGSAKSWTFLLVAGLVLSACSSGGSAANPSITSFTATPASLPMGGGTVTLAWAVAGATSLSISPGVGAVTPVTTGSATASVTTSTSFMLSATNAAGTVTQAAAVCVPTRPVTLAVTTPSSYVCDVDFQAAFAVTNGSCDPVTVTNIQLVDVVSSGGCAAAATTSEPPTTGTVPAGATVTVLDFRVGHSAAGVLARHVPTRVTRTSTTRSRRRLARSQPTLAMPSI